MNELIDDTPEDFGDVMDAVDAGDGASEFAVDNEPIDNNPASFVAPTEPGPYRDDGLGAGTVDLHPLITAEIKRLNGIRTSLAADGLNTWIDPKDDAAITSRLNCMNAENAKSKTAGSLAHCNAYPVGTYTQIKARAAARKKASEGGTTTSTSPDVKKAADAELLKMFTLLKQFTNQELNCQKSIAMLAAVYDRIACLQKYGDPAKCSMVVGQYNEIRAAVDAAVKAGKCTATVADAHPDITAELQRIQAVNTSIFNDGLDDFIDPADTGLIMHRTQCLSQQKAKADGSIANCSAYPVADYATIKARALARKNPTNPNPPVTPPATPPGGSGGNPPPPEIINLPDDTGGTGTDFPVDTGTSSTPTYADGTPMLPQSDMTAEDEKRYWDYISATKKPTGCKDTASFTKFTNQVGFLKLRAAKRRTAMTTLVKDYGAGKIDQTAYSEKYNNLKKWAVYDRQCGQKLRDYVLSCTPIPLNYCATSTQALDTGNFTEGSYTPDGSVPNASGYYSTYPDGTGGNIPAGYYLASDGQIYPVQGGTQYPPVTGQTALPGYYYSNGQLYQIPQGYYKASNGQIYQIPQGYTVGADGNLIYGTTAAQGTSAQTAYCSTTTAVDQYGRTYQQCQYNDATGFHIIRKYQDGSITQQASDGQYYPLTQFPQNQQPYYPPSPYGYPQPTYPQYQTQYDQYGNPISQYQNYPAYNQPYQQYPQSPYYGGYQTPPQNINSPGFEIPETPMDYQSQDMFEQAAPYSRYQGQGGMNLDSQGFIYPAYSQESYVAAAATDPYQSNTIYYGDNGTQEITQVGQPGFLIPETESIDL